MTLRQHLEIIGALLIALAAAHPFFPRYFGWKKELAPLTLLTRRIFYVHSFFIALILALLGALSMLHAGDLLAPGPLSRAILAGMVAFWSLRLVFQFAVYQSEIWRGDRFRTAMHAAFSLFWVYLVITYGAALHHVWNG